MIRNLLFRYKKALFGTLTAGFLLQIVEPADNIGNIIFGNLGALIIRLNPSAFMS